MAHYSEQLPMTGDRWSEYERVRVDPGQTSFFEGREFRTYKELSIAAGQSSWFRIVAGCPIILAKQQLDIDNGQVRQRVVLSDATASGTWTALPVIGKNRLPTRRFPYYDSQVGVGQGGTVTGGTEVEVIRLAAQGSGQSVSTVGGGQFDERGLPAGTYYVQFQNIGTGTVTGVYSIWWQEMARHPSWKVGNTSGG